MRWVDSAAQVMTGIPTTCCTLAHSLVCCQNVDCSCGDAVPCRCPCRPSLCPAPPPSSPLASRAKSPAGRQNVDYSCPTVPLAAALAPLSSKTIPFPSPPPPPGKAPGCSVSSSPQSPIPPFKIPPLHPTHPPVGRQNVDLPCQDAVPPSPSCILSLHTHR